MAKKSTSTVASLTSSSTRKKTSQATKTHSMMKLSSLNKHKSYKRYRGQGRP